jgi:tRNA threonylcarbamoyladenosine biosynthesis protein TsaE
VIRVEIILHTLSESDTESLGRSVGERLFPGALVLLDGDLGAGKTVFARGVGRGLGVSGTIGSPTFNILYIYRGRLPFYHFDLYRLEEDEEIFELGLDEYLEGDGVTLVEWAGKFAGYFSSPALTVTLTRQSDNEREVTLSASGSDYVSLLEEILLVRR